MIKTIKNQQEKQNELKALKQEFDNIQYARDLWRDEDAFGNEFVLLSSGNEKQKARYERIKQEAITKLRVDKK